MEERYEIRGKIGQGGLGAVYRGYDTRMSREVAIKRIQATTDDPELQEESTRQLIKEAGALASLQHPHIVTIYDVGSDEDGPYVVMELISGKTLDELIENAPLTWQDFRELALQTQEALIAAQELDLIHSDIKPSNLMLTWLPSGKFQIKIVDFGLATLTHSQSKEDLEEIEAVFGSIFFMAPEQFERVPLDARTDMYAMGCVYYQALTGIYPFDGQTGMEVMNAHLNHQVTPIQEVRADIPIWACDWIMWHINRLATDRPESARQSLQVFLQNDKAPNPKMSIGSAPPSREALMQAHMAAHGGPQSLRFPRPSTPAMRIQPGQTFPPEGPAAPAPPVPNVAPPTTSLAHAEASKTKTAPQPLKPPEGSKPSVHTEAQPIPDAKPPLTAIMGHHAAATQSGARVAGAGAIRTQQYIPVTPSKSKKGLGKKEKATIAIVLVLILIVGGFFAKKLTGKGGGNEEYAALIADAGKSSTTEIPVNRAKLDMLLKAAEGDPPTSERPNLYKALKLAKATDGTDVDSVITDFTLKNPLLSVDVRESLIREVLRLRKNPALVPALIGYARSTKETRLAVASLQALRYTANEEYFAHLLEIVKSTQSEEIRKAAEESLGEVIAKSTHPSIFASQLAALYKSTTVAPLRNSLLRLLARCGGEAPLNIVKEALTLPQPQTQAAALAALGLWADNSAYPTLIDFLANTSDTNLKTQAFESAFRYASEPSSSRKPDVNEAIWTQLAAQAKWPEQQKKLITGLADYGTEAWAFQLITSFSKNPASDPAVVRLAEETLNKLRGK